MTMKPKARKFRIKRSAPRPGSAALQQEHDPDPEEEEAAPAEVAPMQQQPQRPAPVATAAAAGTGASAHVGETSRPRVGEVASAGQVASETDIDAIRREGLTGRQLRMARRVAQKHGLAPTSDFDAVRLLRTKGIDPFQRSNMLELVVPGQGASEADGTPRPPAPGQQGGAGQGKGPTLGRVQLPQTVPAGGRNMPSTDVTQDNISPAERRAREISQIQRDIARRRRRKMALLATRVMFFVMLPTFLAGWYFYVIATPMFSTKSEFTIIQNEGSGSGMGGLLAGTQFATSGESITVQGYLNSKEAMLRLNNDLGFQEHFQQDVIDPIQRLDPDASIEQAYKLYKKNVKLGFDPTEGVIRMEVIAADPATSASFANRLIQYAEERVNALSAQKREDQMKDALAALDKAEEDRREAQRSLVELQIEGATLDPESVIAALRAQISEINVLITDKEIELDTLLNNIRPNQAKVDGARSTLNILRNRRDALEEDMTDMSRGANSLAQLSINIQMAQADLATRDMMLQSALQQMEQARTEANKQVRYLTVGVNPVAPEEAAYPRAFENTILAFLIFAGIYLMISLTAAILREQVTS